MLHSSLAVQFYSIFSLLSSCSLPKYDIDILLPILNAKIIQYCEIGEVLLEIYDFISLNRIDHLLRTMTCYT